jgi:spore coat-associated protein N
LLLAVLATVTIVGCAPFIGGRPLPAPGGPGRAPGAGRHAIQLGAPGTPANRFDLATSELGPGDSAQRVLDVIVTDRRTRRLGLRVSVSVSSRLDSDAHEGLEVAIDSCRRAWRERVHPLRYTCRGRIRKVLRRAPLAKVKARGEISVRRGGGRVEHLRLRLALPAAAQNDFQALRSTLVFDLIARR